MKETVAILGASNKPDRYAHKAFVMLRNAGHVVIPVHPTLKEVDGVQVVASLDQIKSSIDTLTMYVGPQISEGLSAQILALRPTRVIFNPGTENPELEKTLSDKGINVLKACTLVLLSIGKF